MKLNWISTERDGFPVGERRVLIVDEWGLTFARYDWEVEAFYDDHNIICLNVSHWIYEEKLNELLPDAKQKE